MNIDYSFYFIADEAACYPRSVIDLVAEIVECGITCVQLRMKTASFEKFVATGLELLKILRPKNIPLIINDNIEVAKIINAAGVHIGQNDMPYLQARHYLGPHKIIGLSIQNHDQARRCYQFDVNYFGVGPVYSTKTKIDASNPIGIPLLKKIRQLLPGPIVAIGGISQNNIKEILQLRNIGVAVAAAITTAPNTKIMTQKLAELISQSRKKNA